MIAIINQKGPLGGICTYTVEVHGEETGDVICEFQHYRPDGLAVCLQKAAQAVERIQNKEINKIVESITER